MDKWLSASKAVQETADLAKVAQDAAVKEAQDALLAELPKLKDEAWMFQAPGAALHFSKPGHAP